MANYVIGDIQGCWQQFSKLLDQINFDNTQDILWCVGDLVNRGPQSLEVLEFLMSLDHKPIITLGNHDIYLMKRLANLKVKIDDRDSLANVLASPKAAIILEWLRFQNILYLDNQLDTVMTHAGIPPMWDLEQAIKSAKLLEAGLRSDNFKQILDNIYGNEPAEWRHDLAYFDKLRFTANAFTRMRYITNDGKLDFSCQQSPEFAPLDLTPWFEFPARRMISQNIVFGHWASLQGNCKVNNCYALDTGCIWGGKLTALRLEDKMLFQS